MFCYYQYFLLQTNVVAKVQKVKMELFKEFTRKAAVVIPTYENLRKRIADKKQREGIERLDVPFDVLSSMKCTVWLDDIAFF